MKTLDKWVDVRKKQTREVTDMTVTIVKDESLNSYITLKEVNDLTKPHKIPVNGRWITKLDKNYTILEYTPLDKLYNVRVHINDKEQILEYYFDIILQNEIRKIEGKDIPFYNDLYLDVIYYQKVATQTDNFILLDDRDELKDALNDGKIDQEEYDLAYEVANSLMEELLTNNNIFVNRGLKDYYKYRKNKVKGRDRKKSPSKN